ncbi:hypothetical protein D6D94_04335 [Moraxella catarrhalis]|uniref:Acetyl-CoA dehydrogenase C-terminal like family protein n=1 Tax=Moraxella catarrhalis TaxID=480 RepID=A0A3A9KEL9_MORCA|nr:hypothetical protein A6J52_05895 [Moraxella catarrhalis]EGE16785.1 acyl-CoA dehydrogenase-like protein [Moraxella catarrhalis 12P80B1]EGE19495.1 acyl-CoA dehydrogenase-like protein [Moraxella catarrhalis BC8]EGE21382.1 acyl-CoA dehydrogenase-like protein [Moraxella catarrhalis BC7]AVL50926.1 hypothetical protein CEP83_08000 [Moraxella catarrhalis]
MKTAEFYFAKLMPRHLVHVARINTGFDSLMAMDAEQFAF